MESHFWGFTRALGKLIFEHETRCRALRLQLALLAYRAEHGQLPAQLDELVPGELDWLPQDVYSGGDFLYRPAGVPYPIVADPRSDHLPFATLDSAAVLSAGTPFIGSIGPYIMRRGDMPITPGGPQHWQFARTPSARTADPIASEQELWYAAWCFPIPGGFPDRPPRKIIHPD